MVKDFINHNLWDTEALEEITPRNIIGEIMSLNINVERYKEKPIWKIHSSGKFSLASAYQELRQKGDIFNNFEFVWNKVVPFKISFLLWRIIKRKLPLGNSLAKFGNNSNTDCVCCRDPTRETYNHLFASGEIAKWIWNWISIPL